MKGIFRNPGFRGRAVLCVLAVTLGLLAGGCPQTDGGTSAYTVTFEANGGSPVPAAQAVTGGGRVTLPAAMTKAGFAFGGWYREAALSSQWNFAADTVTGDMTLYARWTDQADSCTVTFEANGGSPVPAAQTAAGGGTVTEPEAMSKTGYTFGGWYKEAEMSTQWNFAADTVTGDMTLYARWISIFNTPALYREMVSLSGGTIVGNAAYNASDGDTLFPDGRTVSLSAFKMAKHETTYELWYEVRQWAANNGYTFANEGREGDDGSDGAAPTTAAKAEPVTYINWRDAVVWCNAYSEMSGKEAVYYTGYGTVLKTSTNDSGTGTEADGAVMKAEANGYRLPTEAEWEYAARGGGTPSTSGPFVYTYAGSNTVDDVAWYSSNSGSVTHPVGTKAANTAGLYDMSGNVWEWCWDWYNSVNTGTVSNPAGPASGSGRVIRGGGWNFSASSCAVAYRFNGSPDYLSSDIGFRLACP